MLKPPKHAKSREIPTKIDLTAVHGHPRSSKVIHLGVNRKPICDFLLVVNSNFSRICTVFEILTLKGRKWLILPTPPLFEDPYLPNPCEYLHNPYITRNYILRTTFLLLTVWVYLHSFSCCSLPNTRNHAKFRENSTLQQFKVIQGHRSWCQSKAHM